MTPHTGGASATLFFDVFEGWGILSKIKAIKTENGADMVSGTSIFRDRMESETANSGNFHVRCIAHLVNLAVR